jgi:DNA-binding NarL/FixJ family response regulator
MAAKPIRILLADDHDMVRAGIRSVLAARDGFEVVAEVEDGAAAVRAAEEHRPDVAILDVTMPGLNGIAATERIRAMGHGTRVIGLSMHNDRQFIDGMLRAGASAYLLKNTAARELNDAIAAVMAGTIYLSPPAAEVMEAQEKGAKAGDLSPREREVLQLLAAGKSSKEIADALFLSVRTVETYRGQIMDKLNIRTIAGLTKYALRQGLTPME